jgi:hypothetical protein
MNIITLSNNSKEKKAKELVSKHNLINSRNLSTSVTQQVQKSALSNNKQRLPEITEIKTAGRTPIAVGSKNLKSNQNFGKNRMPQNMMSTLFTNSTVDPQ